ncbi:hypothetical protein D6856_14325 [Butyrivibrio sp. XB500-5]|uniref:hypothetical protein n=1 Tax=Butyrivibrio sp. XB500-5 TaxID=2364880 RepID=UPI000EA9D083|nr:hypothetical protein [Butyrivibrio sp. XB500-5]RKM56949.1 hypothetical protein D6856_14325 [Butyrivibrio sp. XB500-5]
MGKEILINSHTQIVKGKYIFTDELDRMKNGESEPNALMHKEKTPWFSQCILSRLCRKNY